MIISSCSLIRYGKGVQEDFKNTFHKKKQFFFEIGFDGTVNDKKWFKKSDVAPYRITINILEIRGEISLENVQHPPYYSFDSIHPEKLEVAVSKEIYDVVLKDVQVIKSQNSDSLIVDKEKVLLLSPENLKWIP